MNILKTKYVPLWQAYPLALFVWVGLPWAISLLTQRYGWAAGHPSFWNWLGFVPVMMGVSGLMWGMALHSAQSPGAMEWEMDRSYLLKGSLYSYSRNPMYVSEMMLMVGWVIFYGSAAVLIATLAWMGLFIFYIVPGEERILEARFGEAYREYKRKVPRWIGRAQN